VEKSRSKVGNTILTFPKVEVEHLFYIEATLHPDVPVGDVGRGELCVCPISGGTFEGEKLKGQVMDFGADWNLLYPNKLNIIDTRYLLKTDDGAVISLTTNGRFVISEEKHNAMIKGEWVDPADYYFRQHLFFETADPRYQWLNGACCFAVIGIKNEFIICYDTYMVK